MKNVNLYIFFFISLALQFVQSLPAVSKDKINENCEFLKYDHGSYTKMPACPPPLTYGKTEEGMISCLYPGDKGACKPQSGLVTDKIVTYPCTPNPCQNGGNCISSKTAYICVCQTGYSGPNCEIGSKCSSNPCLNGGTCAYTNSDRDYVCSCPVNVNGYTYFGQNCELKSQSIVTDLCNPNPCQNGGNCISSNNAYMCVCKNNYSGPNCEMARKCASNTCLNGGTCVNTNDARGYVCSCPVNINGYTYFGLNCELKSQSIVTDPCNPNPCQNGGNCLSSNTAYMCACKNSYSGPNCEIVVSGCSSNPCLNRGTCKSTINNGYSCACLSGYSGQRCELYVQGIVSACDLTTCQNGGTCYSTTAGGYFCVCGTSVDGSKIYKGTHCEIEVPAQNACGSSPCLFGGTCIKSDVAPYYTCQCVKSPTGKTYGGIRCELELTSSAITSQCQNSATARFPDPDECQRYYDCSVVYGVIPVNFKQHLDECPYPQMYDTVSARCDDFTKVECGNRKEYVDACDYTRNKPAPGHIMPCSLLYPSCKNKPDGAHEHPGKPMSPDYITCQSERMMGISTCDLDSNGNIQIFDNAQKVCTGYCANQINGYYPHRSDKSKYIQCVNGNTIVGDCGPAFEFVPEVGACRYLLG